MEFLKSNKRIISVGLDSIITVWSLRTMTASFFLSGHTSEITSIYITDDN